MENNKRWSMVVLVATLQLGAFSVAVLTLFSWFNYRIDSTLQRQCNFGNAAIAQLLESSANSNPQTIANTTVPNDGFVALFSVDGTLLDCDDRFRVSFSGSVTSDAFQLKVADTGATYKLDRLPGQDNSFDGELKTTQKDVSPNSWYAHVRKTDQGYFLVAQNTQTASQNDTNAIANSRKVFYGFMLLFGVATVGFMLSMLTRAEEEVASANSDLEEQVNAKTIELDRTQNAIIFGLAKLAESRDTDTGEHLERICKYVTILANDLRSQHPHMDDDYIRNLGLASSLHDIGKVGIPDSILLKPGRLTEKERTVMQYHTVIGGECLEAIQERLGENPFMEMAREIAYSHHERWDGKGYPHQLLGEEIPLVARIVSVADVYDALTSKRPYKRAMSHEESRKILLQGIGTQFDPDVVDAFLRHEKEFTEISISQIDLSDEDCITGLQRLASSVEELRSEVSDVVPQQKIPEGEVDYGPRTAEFNFDDLADSPVTDKATKL
jgi:HD-GYP domain-containing protein (c-di-GMP phosphodiesterase class II)